MSRLACLGLAFQLSHAMQPLSDLLQQDSQDEQARRSGFEEWCQGQLQSESSQRDAMKHLHDRVAPLVSDGAHLNSLSQQVSTLAKQLEKREAAAASATTVRSRTGIDLDDAKRDVHTLSKVQSKLAAKVKGGSFLQAAKGGPLGAVVDLLRSAKVRERTAADKLSEPAKLQKEAGELRAEYEKRSAELAQLQTKQLAAETSRDLLFSAVEDEDAFVADLQDICSLGKDVFKRYEQEVQPAFQKVAQQIAKLGADPTSAPARQATTPAPTTTPVPTTTAAPTTTPPPPTTSPAEHTTTTSTEPPTTPAPPTTTTAPPTTTEAPETDPPTTTAKKVKHHKHHTTTTEAPAPTTTAQTTTPPPPPADIDDDDSAPPPPAPKHKHHKATTTAAPADMDDTFKDDDDAPASVAKNQKSSLLATKATPAPADGTLDPDDDSLPPPSPKHTKKVSAHNPSPPDDDLGLDDDDSSSKPAAQVTKTKSKGKIPSDDDDDMSSAPPPAQKAPKKAVAFKDTKNQFLQDMYASAAGRMPSQYSAWSPASDDDVSGAAKKSGVSAVDDFKKQLDSDDDDDDAAPPPKSKHHAKAHVDADYDTDTPSPPPPQLGGLDDAIRNAPSKSAKKHKFADDTSSIMSIIQQPKDYSAWSPDSPASKASVNQAAGVDLKAAEAAFDSDDFLQLGSEVHQGVASVVRDVLDEDAEDDEAPEAMIFLEQSSSHEEAIGVDASSAILEQFGSVLDSPPLLELAHARLSMPKLKSLWRKVQSVDTSSAQDEHARTEAQWCRDFQKTALAKADAQRVARDKAKAELLKVEAQLTVTNQDAAAVKQVSDAFAAETKKVQSMQAVVQHQFDSSNAIVKRLESEASALGGRAGAVQLTLGQIQGAVASGSVEMGDIMRATVARRSAAEQARKASAAQLQMQSKSLQAKRGALVKAAEAQAEVSTVSGQGSDDHYTQMCKWVLDDAEVKERKQAAEKNAIHSALIVLKAH